MRARAGGGLVSLPAAFGFEWHGSRRRAVAVWPPRSARLSTREEDHHRADADTLVPSKIPSGRGGRGEVS